MTNMNRADRSTYLFFIVGIIAISFSSIFVRWSDADVAVISIYRLFDQSAHASIRLATYHKDYSAE
ncbi:hypothetical protein [Paenibacillus amylolyticus]|uniref:hypothetical protein n=1 Tax=Paenibacillus amylolyticus TaxID=1451 RepID=UPI003EB8D7E9